MLPKLEQGVKRMTERGKREEVQGEAERGDNNKKKKKSEQKKVQLRRHFKILVVKM